MNMVSSLPSKFSTFGNDDAKWMENILFDVELCVVESELRGVGLERTLPRAEL